MFGLRCEDHTWRRNIVWLERPDAVAWECSTLAAERMAECDLNLLWKLGAPITVKVGGKILSLDEWRKFKGKELDRKSIVVDPHFVGASRYDYRLMPDSPALKLGFQSFDISICGTLKDYPAALDIAN
jgi:hypothetical protein